MKNSITKLISFINGVILSFQYGPLNSQLVQQQAALVAATAPQAPTAAATYLSPMTGLPGTAQMAPGLNGLTTAVMSPATGQLNSFLTKLFMELIPKLKIKRSIL